MRVLAVLRMDGANAAERMDARLGRCCAWTARMPRSAWMRALAVLHMDSANAAERMDARERPRFSLAV